MDQLDKGQFYIKEISLHNYRRFDQKTFAFDKNMNVLIGTNASGKTTVLEAVNVALGAYLAAYKIMFPVVLLSIFQIPMFAAKSEHNGERYFDQSRSRAVSM